MNDTHENDSVENLLQPLPVIGYRPQDNLAVEDVNLNKQMEELVLRRLDVLAYDRNVDPRWLSIARTNIEQGFMAMNRAIFQPNRYTGPLN